MTYVIWMFVLIGCWFAVQRTKTSDQALSVSDSWPIALPVASALLGCLVLSSVDNEGWSWTLVPDVFFIGVLFAPLLAVKNTANMPNAGQNEHWRYPSVGPLPTDMIATLAVYALTTDVFIATATAVLFVPLYRSSDALKAWPWAAGGGDAWFGFGLVSIADVTCCCFFVLLLFVLPWLAAPQTKNEEAFDWLGRRDQLQLALWGSVILVSLYLVLTWVLLLASIDAVNFEAHELYGAPFLAALGAASFLYTRRNDDPAVNHDVTGSNGAGVDRGDGVCTGCVRQRQFDCRIPTPHSRPHRLDIVAHADPGVGPDGARSHREHQQSTRKGHMEANTVGCTRCSHGSVSVALGALVDDRVGRPRSS